jgi:membrane fusion protein (multidrug efflux system)
MAVSVQLHAAIPRNVVTVPAVAIRRSAWGDSVFVVAMDEKGAPRAKRVNVDVGSSLGERVIINSGIVNGQQVVADGSFKLQENNLLSATAATSQPATESKAE